MSARSVGGGLLVAAVAALLVSSTALARPAQEVTLTLERASFSGTWRESFLIDGAVDFGGTVGGPAELGASIRRVDPPRNVLARATVSVAAAGAFSGTLHIPARPLPGRYVVRVTATSAGGALTAAEHEVEIGAPAEGIVDRSYASATRGGAPARRVRGPRNELWAHFHFLVLPQSDQVTVVWRTPSFKFVGEARKPARGTVVSFVRSSGAPLQRGVWYAFLQVGDTTVKRVAVRIT